MTNTEKIEPMLFSDRHFAEKEFEKWCKETGASNCASSVFVWLTTPEGNERLKQLCAEVKQ